MSYARQVFCQRVYTAIDVIDELKTMVEEYQRGFPVTQDPRWMVDECIKLRHKLTKLMQDYDDDDDEFIQNCETLSEE